MELETSISPETLKSQIAESSELLKQARQLLKGAEETSKKIATSESKVTEILNRTSESQAKADNEALRAFQAKGMVEEHSNAVAKLKGMIEADYAAITAKKTELETLVQALSTLRGTSEADATSIITARKTVEVALNEATQVSGKSTAIQTSIDETKKNIDVLSQKIGEAAKNVETELAMVVASKQASDTAAAAVQKTLSSVNEINERAKTAHSNIEALEKETKLSAETMSALQKKSGEMDQRVSNYETTLAKLEGSFSGIKAQVESLLPGATSAGLASSFCAQKKRFKIPQRVWMSTFGTCIFLLLVIAAIGAWEHVVTGGPANWDSTWRELVQRLPFVIPLVWLGIYAGRQYMMSLRMEEEYAFKEALSTVFEGYKREMSSIPENAEGPITTLCASVLTLLARRPGLIYEGKHQDITPLTPAVDAVEKILPRAMTFAKNNKNPIVDGE